MSKPIYSLQEVKVKHGTEDFPFCAYHFNTQHYPTLLITSHWHSDYEIIYVQSGCLTFEVAGETIKASEDQVIVINPYEVHSWINIIRYPFRFTCIVFNNSFVFPDAHALVYSKYLKPSPNQVLAFQRIISASQPDEKEAIEKIQIIDRESIEKEDGWELRVLINLLSFFERCLNFQKCKFITNHYTEISYIRDVLYHFHTNYSSEISISKIADGMNVSTEHLIRVFKRATGKTPKKYLLDYRLQCVSTKLIESDRKISDIAAECGFYDMSYFSKCFRRYTGETPAQWRKEQNA